MESKKDIRKRVLKQRNLINREEWEEKSRRICEKVTTHPFFLNADAIYCYVDYKNEVCTRDILAQAWKLGKNVAVPKVNGEEMSFYYIDNMGELKAGYFGILEPTTTNTADDENVLVIMPGAAFDQNKNRIGYGKGFYDRYLERHPQHRTIALAFAFQMIEGIPSDTHDIQPDIIITEETIYV